MDNLEKLLLFYVSLIIICLVVLFAVETSRNNELSQTPSTKQILLEAGLRVVDGEVWQGLFSGKTTIYIDNLSDFINIAKELSVEVVYYTKNRYETVMFFHEGLRYIWYS